MDNPFANQEHLPDAALVRRAQQGNRGAFDELAYRYRSKLLAAASARTGNRDIAEDLVQDILACAWQKLPTLSEPQAFPAWLNAIAVNTCHMWRRRTPWTDSLDVPECAISLRDLHPGPLESMLAQEQTSALYQAIQLLPEENRRALVLHLWGHCSYQQIAQQLHIPLTTVEGRIHRAKQQLRRILGENSVISTPGEKCQGGKVMVHENESLDRMQALWLFTRQLATLIDAGISQPYALQLLSEEAPAPYDAVAKTLQARVVNGERLSQIIKEMPDDFPPFYSPLLWSGEGYRQSLDEALRFIADLLEPLTKGDHTSIIGDGKAVSQPLALLIFTKQYMSLVGRHYSPYLWRWNFANNEVPPPYREFASAMAEQKPPSFFQALASRPDLNSPTYRAQIHAGEQAGQLKEAMRVLVGVMIDDCSLFAVQSTPLPEHWEGYSEKQRVTLMQLFCRVMSMHLVWRDAFSSAAALLPADLRARVQEIAGAGYHGDEKDIRERLSFLPEFVLELVSLEHQFRPGSMWAQAAELLRLQADKSIAPLAVFSRQLSQLINAGVSLVRSLLFLRYLAPEPYAEAAFAVQQRVMQGDRLTTAMEANPELFPRYYTIMVNLGEECGTLHEIFAHAAEMTELLSQDASASNIRALRVVCRLMGTMFTAGLNLSTVLKLLGEIAPAPYAQIMPEIHRRVMENQTLTETLTNYQELFPPYARIFVRIGEVSGMLDEAMLILADMLEESERFAPLWGGAPFLSPDIPDIANMNVWQQKLLFRWVCRNMSMMLTAGVPVPMALDRIATLLPIAQREAVSKLAKRPLTTGIARPLARLGFLPPLITRMMTIAEPTDRFGLMLGKTAQIYLDELTSALMEKHETHA